MKRSEQPSGFNVKSAILSFPGPVLTYRSFKQPTSPSALRTVTLTEFDSALQELCQSYDKTVVARVARAPKPTTVFVKNNPASFDPWPADALISFELYERKYEHPCHNAISQHLKRLLANQGLLNSNEMNGQQ